MCLFPFVSLETPGRSPLRWSVSLHTGHSLIQLLLFATVVKLDPTVNVKCVHYLWWPDVPKVPAGSIAFYARLWRQMYYMKEGQNCEALLCAWQARALLGITYNHSDIGP